MRKEVLQQEKVLWMRCAQKVFGLLFMNEEGDHSQPFCEDRERSLSVPLLFAQVVPELSDCFGDCQQLVLDD